MTINLPFISIGAITAISLFFLCATIKPGEMKKKTNDY